ncbi:hypothetical protein EBPL_00244 [Enterobacter phage EBPL]|uniref:Uncharacterized protein n=1 Tax=Enterobacter phage EBPL TaxID=2729191 RepID=A0A6M3YN79_9CAUD|nr:hypothetical protein EBPL_00244 [Enterobacter phage EBPL]
MKIVQRNISEVSQQEKVQIHFKFNDLKLGYAQIAREHMLDNGDIYVIVQEIERIRAFRAENPKVKHVLRRVYINKHREEKRKPKTKAKRDPRPDNKRKAINGAMALAFQEAGLV